MTAQLDRALVELRLYFADEIASGEITRIGTQGDCRRKNHTDDGPYSEHAWPGGNAADVHVKVHNGKVGDRIAAWMRSRPDLWSEVFWKIFLHEDHVHGTANPRMNYDNEQIPPCAEPEGGDEMDISRKDKADEGIKELTPYMDQLRASGAMTKDTQPGGVTFNDELAKFLVVHIEAVLQEFERTLVERYNLGSPPIVELTAPVRVEGAITGTITPQ